MDIKELVMMLTFGGSILGIVGFVLGNTRSETNKRSRIYERLDEVKCDVEEKFVAKDICSVVHTQIAGDLKEMKADIKSILRNNGGDK